VADNENSLRSAPLQVVARWPLYVLLFGALVTAAWFVALCSGAVLAGLWLMQLAG
jgi:hypothetical protein